MNETVASLSDDTDTFECDGCGKLRHATEIGETVIVGDDETSPYCIYCTDEATEEE